ncbi:DUF4810 domain-containing protein [Paraburkholderia graminis]|uniref:DUF4810 domain-containing protein n=1 Tax=Paraburkholderia graminis TaxID=60548 RepID=UPI0038B727BE
MNRSEILWLAALSAILSGCAAPPTPPLYLWHGYQPQAYEYLKGQTSQRQQIDALGKSLQQINAKGKTPPPGFHAHLGMLYAEVGNSDQAKQQFEAEKQLFPESSAYMDFLLNKSRKL